MRRIRRCRILLVLVASVIYSSTAFAQNHTTTGFQPLDMLIYVMRSRLNAELFRYDEAIADMDAAIALAPNNARLYVERGQRILLLYEWDRALADYNRALELDPDYADAYYYRGVLYASVPEGYEARQAALNNFRRYLDLLPEGDHADDATRYIAEIQAQLDALSSP